jgi:hypothetical protein
LCASTLCSNTVFSDDLVSHMERFLDTFSSLLHQNNYVMITGNNNTTY